MSYTGGRSFRGIKPLGGITPRKEFRVRKGDKKLINVGSRKIRKTQERIFSGKKCPECFTSPMGTNGFCKTCVAVSLVKY